jgi:hypothetical protein
MGAPVEPCSDTVEFVGEFPIERGKCRRFGEQLSDDHALIVEDVAGTPGPNETALLEFGAALTG